MKTSNFYLPYNSKLVARAKSLRKNMTQAEKKLWYDYLRHFHCRIHRQRPIDNFIVDFYCPRAKLVIEVDGEIHDTESAQQYDQKRTRRLEGYGLTVVRFTNQEVLNHFAEVCEKIAELIPPTSL